MIQIKSVLIADEIENECIDALTQHGLKVDKKTKQTEDQLCVLLKNYDAVIVRSATKVIILNSILKHRYIEHSFRNNDIFKFSFQD